MWSVKNGPLIVNGCLRGDAVYSSEDGAEHTALGYQAVQSQPTGDNVTFGDPDGRLAREWQEANKHRTLGYIAPQSSCEGTVADAKHSLVGYVAGYGNVILSPKRSLIRRLLDSLRSK